MVVGCYDDTMEQHQQKPRFDDILEAHRLLGLVISAAANGRAAVDRFAMQDNAFSYATGIGSVEVVVTTRNFMDARREALAKSGGLLIADGNFGEPIVTPPRS